jgi:glutamate carboxypeptidase
VIAELEALVQAESPSADDDLTATATRLVDDLLLEHLGSRGRWIAEGARGHLLWSGGGPTKVLLVGHVDTVWPVGTAARWPFSVQGDRATGPGCFDMKAGLVQGIYALAGLDDLEGVALVVTTDEEVGSPTSRVLIEQAAAGARAALVLEPSADAALKSVRKGVSMYQLVVHGRAAHAGLEPERGANAAVELAHQVIALLDLADLSRATTVTPTLLAAGTTTNTVPASGSVAIDVRAVDVAEQQRVDQALRKLVARTPGTSLELLGGINRPPLDAAASSDLLVRARRIAASLGMPPLQDVAVGGGSDGNFTAGIGVPTLDGLGAVGAGAHAEGEHVLVSTMPERSALVRELVRELLR